MISGKSKRLPAITKKPKVAASIPDAAAALGINPEVLNLIYDPVETILQKVQQATTTFCSINWIPNSEEVNTLIQDRFEELIKSYTNAREAVEVMLIIINITPEKKSDQTKTLEEEINTENGELIIRQLTDAEKQKLQPFEPALEKLKILLGEFEIELKKQGVPGPSKEDYDALCKALIDNIEGSDGLRFLYLRQLGITSEYLVITTRINACINAFNTLGNSVYPPKKTSSKEADQLSELQLKNKWWALEDQLKELSECYESEIKNHLLEHEREVYTNFKALLKNLQAQLADPLELFSILNEQEKITQKEKEDQFLEAYGDAHNAVNFQGTDDIPKLLAEALQQILNEQSGLKLII
jgi:hypothetical protein